MINRRILIISLFAIAVFITWIIYSKQTTTKGNIFQPDLNEEVKNILKQTIDTNTSEVILGDQFMLSSSDLIREYYKKNNYTPVWVGKSKETPIADSLIFQIKESVNEGLNSLDYHIQGIEALQKELIYYNEFNSSAMAFTKWAYFELLLTDAFFLYTQNLYAGRIHNESINKEWINKITLINVVDSLKKISSQNSISKTINNFNCTYPQYLKLKMLMRQYVNINKLGGWPVLKNENAFGTGDIKVDEMALYNRLFMTKNSPPAKTDTAFESELINAVKLFQHTHNLKVNGIIDEETLTELNIPVSKRIKQIALNMERWRWLPREMKKDFVFVNTAGYKLDLMDPNRSIMDMKIIVGKTDHRTPVFNADMVYIILNPWWEVPMSIAKKEILPKIKKDYSYLKKENIKIYNSWEEEAEEIPAESINWNLVTSENFNYRLRQSPGVWNALGRIKFIFPNNYIELAVYLLRNNSNWNEEKILEFLESDKTKTIVLPVPIKVFIDYHTIWFDKDTFYFGKDIYGYDAEFERQFAN